MNKGSVHRNKNISCKRAVKWSQEGSRLFISVDGYSVYADMPEEFQIDAVDPALRELSEHLLLWNLEHNPFYKLYETTPSIANTIIQNQQLDTEQGEDLTHTSPILPKIRTRKGDNIALSFSCGFDSGAALLLLPKKRTIPIYIAKAHDPKANLVPMYGIRKINAMPEFPNPMVVSSNFETLAPKLYPDRRNGFSLGIGYASIIVLLADILKLGSICFGSVLGDFFCGSATKFIDVTNPDRPGESKFIRMKRFFAYYDIDLCFPTAGFAEPITQNVVLNSPLKDVCSPCDYNPSRETSIYCNKCFKCFKKQGYLGQEVSTYYPYNLFKKFPFPSAMELLFSLKCNGMYDKLVENSYGEDYLKLYRDYDLTFQTRYLPIFIEPDSPKRVSAVTSDILECIKEFIQEYDIKPMTPKDMANLKNFQELFELFRKKLAKSI